MSYAFITAIKQNPQQSYVQLLNSIRDVLEEKYEQKPQLSCSHPLGTSDLAFYEIGATANVVNRYEPIIRHVRAALGFLGVMGFWGGEERLGEMLGCGVSRW